MLEWAALAAGLLAVYSWRADFARYSIFTVGVFRRVERTAVEGVEFECADPICEATTEKAERRKWFKEVVIAGMPLIRVGGGQSHYCEDHVAFEVRDQLDSPEQPMPEKLAGGLAAVVLWIGENVVGPFPDDTEYSNDEFSSATTSVSAGLELLPIVFLVLVAAVVLGTVKAVGGEPALEIETE